MPLTRRLEEYIPLTETDRKALARLSAQPTRTIPPRYDLIREGEVPDFVYLVMSGWGCHYRTLEDGRRQIVDFAIPATSAISTSSSSTGWTIRSERSLGSRWRKSGATCFAGW